MGGRSRRVHFCNELPGVITMGFRERQEPSISISFQMRREVVAHLRPVHFLFKKKKKISVGGGGLFGEIEREEF